MLTALSSQGFPPMRTAMHSRGGLAVLTTLLLACGTPDAAPTALRPVHNDVALTVNKAEFPLADSATVDERTDGVTTDGTNALVPLTVNQYLRIKLVSPTSGVLKTIKINRQVKKARAAFDGTNFMVVWQDLTDANKRVWGLKVSAAGAAIGAPFAVSTTTNVDAVVGLEHAGGKYLVTYDAPAQSGDKLMGRFFVPGVSLDTTFVIAESAVKEGYNNLATDGTNFLAIWLKTTISGYGISARRIASSNAAMSTAAQLDDGVTLDAIGVAYNSVYYLVTYEKTGTSEDEFGQLVQTSGSPFLSPFTINAQVGRQVGGITFARGDSVFCGVQAQDVNHNMVIRGTVVSALGGHAVPTQYFKTSSLGKAALPVGVSIGTKIFFAINRYTPATDKYDLGAGTSLDVRANVVTP
jgi:hypothetical protein